MNNNRHTLFKLLWQWSEIVDRARQIKSDPERRQKSVRFGLFAVIYALLTAVFACALLLFNFVGDGLVITIFCVVFGFGFGVVGTLICFITALIQWFCQLSINRRPMTWISLALVLLCFAAAVAIPLVFLTL